MLPREGLTVSLKGRGGEGRGGEEARVVGKEAMRREVTREG